MKRLLALAIPFILSILLGPIVLHAQASTMSYDAFMKLDVQPRREQFPQLSPSDQADLVREQLIRWRRVHATELTEEQRQVVAILATHIQPEFFSSSVQDKASRATFAALQQRASKVFTPEELANLFTVYGPYLPPQP
jgi:hypothetical protein